MSLLTTFTFQIESVTAEGFHPSATLLDSQRCAHHILAQITAQSWPSIMLRWFCSLVKRLQSSPPIEHQYDNEPCLNLVSQGAYRRLVVSLLLTGNLAHPDVTGLLQREALDLAPRAILRQLRRSPTPESEHDDAAAPVTPPEETPLEEETMGGQPTLSTIEQQPILDIIEQQPALGIIKQQSTFGIIRRQPTLSISAVSSLLSFSKSLSRRTKDADNSWKEPQPFEVLRAIERKDVMYLMNIRDRAFPLLLRKSGNVTPLLHAMRIGTSHRDVTVILLGAFSRYVNYLEDADVNKPETKMILKALRTNLKLAIDYGLAKSQSDLIASFLQTLVMSEGERWVTSQITNISRALRSGVAGKPVHEAGFAVRKFTTRELGKADLIASLEDYLANATADLVMMSAWAITSEYISDELIPTYYLARDDHVYKTFVDKLDRHKRAIQHLPDRRLKWQLRVLRSALEGRVITFRRKVELLASQLDEGEGV